MVPQVEETKPLSSSGAQQLRIGPAGWSYPDWAGIVYPARKSREFQPAAYLAGFFDTIEINTSFYRPIQPQHARLWAAQVAGHARFRFTAKLWQKFTHDPAVTREDVRAVRAGFEVLMQAGRLGAVLAQFPFAFHRTKETVVYLQALLKRLPEFPLVVELRHGSWETPETFELLRSHAAGFCNIDQPVIGRSLHPSAQATSPVGYVRLHGRRYDTWFSEDPALPPHERYNYLYQEEELEPWAERTREVMQKTRETYVITNNHFQGKAVVNALQLIRLLTGKKVEIPESLREHYPQLDSIAASPPAEPSLFPPPKPPG